MTKLNVNLRGAVKMGESLINCIMSYVGVGSSESKPCDNLSSEITNMLIGSKKMRLGRSPNNEQVNFIQKTVQRCVEANQPIELVSLWGATKGYGRDDERNIADIMDVVALRRFTNLNNRVGAIYKPGVRTTIIRENVGEYELTGDKPDTPAKMRSYCESLDGLCCALGVTDAVQFVDESDLLRERGFTDGDFRKLSQENARVFVNYWLASDACDESCWENLPEYKKLTDLGWKGVIPHIMREHYLDRVETEHPNMNDEEKARQVCAYLGTAFARYQTKMVQGSSIDRDGNVIAPFKASFVPYPPGTDESLSRGRLEYKVKDSKNSNNSTPPWAGHGVMVQKEGSENFDPKILSLRQYRLVSPDSLVPVVIEFNSNSGSQTINSSVQFQSL